MGLIETLILGGYIYTTLFGGFLYRLITGRFGLLRDNHLKHLEERISAVEKKLGRGTRKR